ncbi:gsl3070 [Gloeobacter violaceus PCC 7421]|uniref:Gsl3070 protein n=2 Tax=Gloeobacter violaceus TaxID=33072 RepID=Q7NCA9_GLOVI|nr:gsl3070 [Gloeobacter violaceus PCC 7421]
MAITMNDESVPRLPDPKTRERLRRSLLAAASSLREMNLELQAIEDDLLRRNAELLTSRPEG